MKKLKTKLNRLAGKTLGAKMYVEMYVVEKMQHKDRGEKNVVVEMLFMAIGVAAVAAIAAFITLNWTSICTKMQNVIDTVF